MTLRLPERRRDSDGGFALIAVIMVVAVVTVVSMELVASLGLEARGAAARLEALKLERLALGGHEVAAYLEQAGLLVPDADLAGLPVDVVGTGRGTEYRIVFPGGTTTIRFAADNGKVSLTSAPEVLLSAVFTRWTGDAARGDRLAQAVVDWRDPDQLSAGAQAESADYPDSRFGPRNAGFGVGDAHLVAGVGTEDFLPAALDGIEPGTGWLLPEGLYSLVTPIPTDGRINPNFAPVPVLETLPGIDAATARLLAELREQRDFESNVDLAERGGIAPGADTWNWVTLGTAATRTVRVRVENPDGMSQTLRRTYRSMNVYNPTANRMEPRELLVDEIVFDPEVVSLDLP